MPNGLRTCKLQTVDSVINFVEKVETLDVKHQQRLRRDGNEKRRYEIQNIVERNFNGRT